MYVVDTTLAPGSRIRRDESLQRLVFESPSELQRKVPKDLRKLFGKDKASLAPLPWDVDGFVRFSYSGASRRSQPLFCDRRDHPLARRHHHLICAGQKVRLSLRLVPRSRRALTTRLEVLKVQLLHIDAPIGKNSPVSPHSIQTLSLSLPVDLIQSVERLAAAGDWSISAWLRDAIEREVGRQQKG